MMKSEEDQLSLQNLDESAISPDVWHCEQTKDRKLIFNSTIIERRYSTDSGNSDGISSEGSTLISAVHAKLSERTNSIDNGNVEELVYDAINERNTKKRGRPRKSSVEIHQCDICERHLASRQALKTHSLTHTGNRPFKCDFELCEYSAITKQNLEFHRKKHHINPIKGDVQIRRSTKGNQSITIHRCSFCDLNLSSENALEAHMNGVHMNLRQFKCDIGHCQKRFPDIHRCNKHRLTHWIKKRPCKICGKYFIDLLEHSIRKHKMPIFHECDICLKQFLKMHSLQRHMINHSQIKCEICNACFPDEESKQQHSMESHSII